MLLLVLDQSKEKHLAPLATTLSSYWFSYSLHRFQLCDCANTKQCVISDLFTLSPILQSDSQGRIQDFYYFFFLFCVCVCGGGWGLGGGG